MSNISDPSRLLGIGWCAAYIDGCYAPTAPCEACGYPHNCMRHGHVWALHKRHCERAIPHLAWLDSGPGAGQAEILVWGCHPGDPLHVRIEGIEDDWDEEGWFAKYERVVYVATGVELDEDLEATYSDAFEYVAHRFGSD